MVGWVCGSDPCHHRGLRQEARGPHPSSQDLGGPLPIPCGNQGFNDQDSAEAIDHHFELSSPGYLDGCQRLGSHLEEIQDLGVPYGGGAEGVLMPLEQLDFAIDNLF